MAILDDRINVSPTLAETGCKVTVALMVHNAHTYLYTAKWPEYVKAIIYGIGNKALNLKEFQRHARQIEMMIREDIMKLQIDGIQEELDNYINSIFGDTHISASPECKDAYYFNNSAGNLIMMIAITSRPVA